MTAISVFLSGHIAIGAPPNDRFVNAIALSGWVATSTVDPAGANENINWSTGSVPPNSDPYAGAGIYSVSLWWSYTPPADGEVTISVSPIPAQAEPIVLPSTTAQGFIVNLYADTPNPVKPGKSNFFDQRTGGLLLGQPSYSISAVDSRFLAKGGQTYWIEVGVFGPSSTGFAAPGRTWPVTVKVATSVGRTSWYWQGAQASGTGYAIEVRGGNVFAGFFIYNSDGTPNWLVASGPLVNGTHFSAPLQQYAGGKSFLFFQNPSQAGQITGSPGNVTIDWTGSCTAVMTWPGGTLPISCFVFDSGAGWMNSDKPNGYHDTGWYWLAADGGGRGFFGQAQGSSEFWAMFHYDAGGRATWNVATVMGLPTDSAKSFSGGNSGGCAAWQGGINPVTQQPYLLAYPFSVFADGQTLTGSWQPATQIGYLDYNAQTISNPSSLAIETGKVAESEFSCGPMQQYSAANYSSLGQSVYLGPSTSLAGSTLEIDGINTPDAVLPASTASSNSYVQASSPITTSYISLCNGICRLDRFQF